jgi:hypothetical protein
MDIKTNAVRLALARGELVRIANARGASIHDEAGVLWITLDRDLKDYFVKAGESLQINDDGPAVIYALEAATFRVEPQDDDLLENWWDPFWRRSTTVRQSA